MTYNKDAGGYGNVFGSRVAGAVNEYQLSAYNGGIVSVGRRNTVGGITINEVHTVEFDGDTTVYIDGVPKTITTTSLTQNIHKIYLFGLDQAGTFIQGEKTRIYSCSFGDIRNFIPCYRKSDNEPGMYDTITGTFYTNSGTGTFTVGNDVSYSTTNLTETRRKIILNSPHLESSSGNISTFSTDMTAKLKSCRVNFLPKQSGSGDPSPDNVRAITGIKASSVYNLVNGEYVFPSGDLNMTVNDVTLTYENDTYIFMGTTSSATIYDFAVSQDTLYGYDTFMICANQDINESNFAIKIFGNDTRNVVFRPSSAVNRGIYICSLSDFPSDFTISKMRIAIGSGFTNLKLFLMLFNDDEGVQYPVNWSNTVGTVYGGYVDIPNGELVAEWAKITIDGSQKLYRGTDTYDDTNATNRFIALPKRAVNLSPSNSVLYLDRFKSSTANIWAKPNDYIWQACINNYS